MSEKAGLRRQSDGKIRPVPTHDPTTHSAARIDNSVLRHEIALAHHGIGDRDTMVAALRASVLYVPRAGERSVLTADQGGLRWIYAFTTAEELAAFFTARGEGEQSVRYVTVRGDRLLDEAVPDVSGPSGVALDVAGVAPMLLPAVSGVVRDQHAIDLAGAEQS